MYEGRAGEKYKASTTHDVHIFECHYNGNNKALNVTIVSTSLSNFTFGSDAISEHLFFQNFPWGHMPPDAPSKSMLCILSVLCTQLQRLLPFPEV